MASEPWKHGSLLIVLQVKEAVPDNDPLELLPELELPHVCKVSRLAWETAAPQVDHHLVVHRERIIERSIGGRATVKTLERQSFGEAIGASPLVELTPAEVARHAHALEPYPVSESDPSSVEQSRATAAALERHHAKPATCGDEAQPYEERVAVAAVSAVIDVLKSAGMLRAAK